MYRSIHHMIKDHSHCSQTPQSQPIQLFGLTSVDCLHNPHIGHGNKELKVIVALLRPASSAPCLAKTLANKRRGALNR